ncbi:MAG: TetR/AcrR family transcriptional regulator [Spirochaetia bacterium]
MRDVRNEILKTGYQVFSEMGFKKAGIREIVERCGISIGSFYKHFSSKEELFIHLYLEENRDVLTDLALEIPRLEREGNTAWQIIEQLISRLLKRFALNPILREYYNRPQFEKIFAKLSPELDEKYKQAVVSIWGKEIARWQARGEIKDVSIEFVFSLVNSIALVVSQREYVAGPGVDFNKVQQFLVTAVSRHLKN